MSPEEELRRAGKAQRLLDDPLFKQAREHIEAELEILRRNVPIGQSDMHTRIILYGQLADRFFGFFELLAQTGKFAQLHLDQEEARRKGALERMLSFAKFGRNAL